MRLTTEQVKNFQQLYKEHFSIDLTDDEAHDEALKLIQAVKLTLQPIEPVELKPITETELKPVKLPKLRPLDE